VEATPFTPPTIEALNKLLPAYHFLDFIAQGGMGAVYLAKQVSLDRQVAVKILPRELSADPEFRASFQTEARAMAKLNHPNLISIFDSGDVDGMLYIAMEYVPGKSLYHSAWNKKVDPAEASRIIIAICEGLSHAHENGIIHRDIKPANILLTPKIEPKIGDFGLAQAVGVKHEGIVMGTPGYAAPEVISHPERADRRSDIFAVGVMLHELLTGKKPEPNVSASSISGCPKEYDLIIQRATHPNPVMRFPDASSMALALREIGKPSAAAKANPLLTKAAARPAAMARPAAAAGAPKIPATAGKSPAPTNDDDNDLPIPALVVPSSSASWGYIRNLLIIAALSIVVVFVYQKLQIHKQEVAKKEEAYMLKQKEEEMRRRREAEQALANAQNNPTTPEDGITTPVTPKPTIPEPKEETAMESLERLQYDLSKGSRAEMPIGSKRRGELDYFLVPTPMPWDSALLFAEKHGGHIALPTNEDELTFLTSLLKNSETIWLGAGRSGRDQWLLLDGSPWSLEKTPPGLGNYATLSHLGNVRAGEASRELPFIIAWHRDGSNPSSLMNLLLTTRKSLDTQSPRFPPGTEAVGARYFLPIVRPMTRAEAYEMAQQAGAHVAALSNREENYWVTDTLASLKAERGIWLGGEKIGGVWQWVTKEPWTYAQWAADSPDDDEDATLLVYLPGKGWHNLDKEEQADGVLLEWSQDASPSENTSVTLNTPSIGIGPLVTKCRELIVASQKERDDKHAANVKSFNWDLDVWLRGLKPLEKTQWQESVEVMKSLTRRGRIPTPADVAQEFRADDGVPNMHAGIVKIHNYCVAKQTEIDAGYELRNGKIRDSYILKIKEMGANAQKSGQLDLVRQLKEYLEDAEDLNQWVDSMLEE
jgi:serine/threonine protein kinase